MKLYVAFRDEAGRESQIVNVTIIVEVDDPPMSQLSSASLLIILIIIIGVCLSGYYNWKKKAEED